MGTLCGVQGAMSDRLYFLLGVIAGLLIAQLVIDTQLAAMEPVIIPFPSPPMPRDVSPPG